MVDIIRLFPASATSFDSLGKGVLTDVHSCVVTEKRNDTYTMQFRYPITGKHYEDIELRSIVVAKPNPWDNPQAFRVNSISKPIKGIVTFDCEHISYDLTGYPVTPFTAEGASNAFLAMKEHSVLPCPFNFYTDKTANSIMELKTPNSMRKLLAGSEGSFLDSFGTGEYWFDNYDVHLYLHRGMNRGVTIKYGKNLTSIKQDENCDKVYTGVYPYWYSKEQGKLVELDQHVINIETTYNFSRIMMLDCGEYFQEEPTKQQLENRAKKYIADNDIGVPDVSLDISFAQLRGTGELENINLLEEVHLCDTVTVIFEELGVNATAKVVETQYNVLTGKYDKIKVGSVKTTLATSLANNFKKLDEIPDASEISDMAVKATKMITGGYGGYVCIRNSGSESTQSPDEILIMDEPSIYTASKVWRWNKNGLGYSDNGYNGPYNTAITADGQIVADVIGAGTLKSSLTLANIIRTISGNMTLSDNGLSIKSVLAGIFTSIGPGGLIISSTDDSSITFFVSEDRVMASNLSIENSMSLGRMKIVPTPYGAEIYYI